MNRDTLNGCNIAACSKIKQKNTHMDIIEYKNKILKQYKAPIIKLADTMNIKTKNGNNSKYVQNADVVI